MVVKWIQKIHLKKWVLHKQLGISKDEKIPLALLNKIISAKPGETITNPTNKGSKRIKVTRLLERRSILARNLKSIAKR